MNPDRPTENPRTADTGLPEYASDDRSAAQIDRDLRATRARIDRHLDDLTRRTNPLNLARSLLGGGGGGGGGRGGASAAPGEGPAAGTYADGDGGDDGTSFAEVRDAVVEKARRNPIGLAMIGAGLAWSLLVEDDRAVLHRARQGYHDARDRAADAFASSEDDGTDASGGRLGPRARRRRVAGGRTMMPSGHSTTGEYASATPADDGGPGVGDRLKSGASAAGQRAHDAASAAGSSASSAASAVGDAASSAASSVGDAASSIGDMLGSAASRLRGGGSRAGHRLGDASHRATDRGGDLASGLFDAAKANPLLAGAVALGLGALLGGLVPETRKEDELFGEKADELKAAAAERAHEATEAAKQKASSAAEGAKEQAKEAGEHLKEAALSAGDDLAHAVTEEIDKASKQAGEKLDEAVPPPSKTQEAVDAGADRADEKVQEANDAASDKVSKPDDRQGS